MEIHKVEEMAEMKHEEESLDCEALVRERSYMAAERLCRKLLDAGFVSEAEFKRIMQRNVMSFRPHLAELNVN
jgi:hypothetical protein